MTSRRPDPDSAEARAARWCIRRLWRLDGGFGPVSWAARRLIKALRRHAPPRPPVTVLQSGTLALATVIAAVEVDGQDPASVFAALAPILAAAFPIGVSDPDRPLHVYELGSAVPALELSPAAAERAEVAAAILGRAARLRRLWLRAAWQRMRGRQISAWPAPEDAAEALSALDKLAYQAMQPWAGDDVSRAIAAKAGQLARRAPIDHMERMQALGMLNMGICGALVGGRSLAEFVRRWQWAALLTVRQRHAPWLLAPERSRAQRRPLPCDAPATGHPYRPGSRRGPPIGELGSVHARRQAARDGPLNAAGVGWLDTTRRSPARPAGPVYGPLAARIRAAASAWKQSRAALDAIGVLRPLRDAGLASACAGIVACHPHTGPPLLLAASGGHAMTP